MRVVPDIHFAIPGVSRDSHSFEIQAGFGIYDVSERRAILDVPANSQSELACSEFAVGWDRWYGRIAIVICFLYFVLSFPIVIRTGYFPRFNFVTNHFI